MKSLWMNLGVKSIANAETFYRNIGFSVETHGNIQSVTLKGGGQLILYPIEQFEKIVPFSPAKIGNEVLISLNVDTEHEVDELIARVRENGGKITVPPTHRAGCYGACFTDLDNHHFNVIVM